MIGAKSWTFALLSSVVSLSVALASPSDKQPHASLDIHGQQHAPQLLTAAQKLADDNRAAIEKFEALVKDNKILKVNPLDLGAAHVNAIRLQRAADQLILLGEPAGIDYALRAGQQSVAVQRITVALQAIPEAAQGIGRLRSQASQVAAARQKQLPKLQKLVVQKDWEAAERELYEVFDDLERFVIYMAVEGRVSTYQPWTELQRIIVTEATAARTEAAKKLLAERLDATKADLSKLLADVQASAAALKQAEKHSIDDETLTGPELIAHFDAAWQKAHIATIKSLAIAWAQQTQGVKGSTVRADHEAFAKAIGPALRSIIASDTSRVSANDAAALYQAYLPVVADLVDHSGGALENEMQSALDELAAKSPELAANLQAYRAVTDDLLRWRERVAAEQASVQATTFPEPRGPVHAAFQRSAETAGLFEPDPVTLAKARLNDPAGKILEAGSPKLVGKNVTLRDIGALGSNSQAGIARFNERLYGRLTLPASALAAEITALEQQLMIAENQPALSLAATRAVRSARRGDLVQAGGAVRGIFLEGHVTRFATLPDAAALLLPLGTLPAEHPESDQLHQVALRLDLEPQWVQQRHVFLKLPTP